MLGHLPSALGHALDGLRAGAASLTFHGEAAAAPETIALTSPAFAAGGALPVRFTADGEGVSPPLAWTGVPEGTAALLLLVEDADSPTPSPLVHAIVTDLPPCDGTLAENALPGPAEDSPEAPPEGAGMGRNSFLRGGWLPPDPPPGHGPHRYAFQLYALDRDPAFDGTPGRGAVEAALRGHLLAKGALVGTYGRG